MGAPSSFTSTMKTSDADKALGDAPSNEAAVEKTGILILIFAKKEKTLL